MFFLITILVTVTVCLYFWLTWHHNHWKRLNVPHLEPNLFLGNMKDFIFMKKIKSLAYDDLYRKSEHPALGIFSMRDPQLLIRDQDLAKKLFINEFSKFRDNDYYVESTDFIHTTNAFFLCGEKWKKTRSMVTPTLTVGKLKPYFPQIVECSRDMIQYVEKNPDKEFEAFYFSGLFTTDTVMGYTYGIASNCFTDPDSNYRKVTDKIFHTTWVPAVKYIFASFYRKIGNFLKIKVIPRMFIDFYTQVVRETMAYRKLNNVKRNDFLQVVMDSIVKGDLPAMSPYEITGITMNSNDISNTTGTVLGHIVELLLRHPESQEKLRQEIDERIHSLDDITYENINSIPYLTAFIHESLRMRPPLPLMEKRCTEDCQVTFQGKTYDFKKGDKVALNLLSIQMDPKYFPNPEEFIPERFLDKEDLPGYLAFGIGPRTCLGKTLAMIQMKVFLCSLLKHYEILPSRPLPTRTEFDVNSILFLYIKNGVWFKVKKR